MTGVDTFGPLIQRRLNDGQYVWDFTLLFEDSILITGPFALGILLILTELGRKAFQKPNRTIIPSLGALGWGKLILYSALIVLTVYHTAQLVTWSARGLAHGSTLSSVAAALEIVAILLITIDNGLHHLSRLKPSSPSQFLLGWWIISDAATVRSRWLLGGYDRVLSCVGVASAVLKLVIIVGEEWSKRGILLPHWLHNSPEALAGIFNRMLLVWLNPLIVRGLGGTIDLEDLWPLEDHFASQRIMTEMAAKRQLYGSGDKHLFWVLLREHWYLWLAPFPTRMAQTGFQFAQPFLLQQTLRWLYGLTDNSTAVGYGLLGAYAVTYTGIAVTTAFSQYQLVRLVTAIRGSLIIRIYQKSLQKSGTQDSDLAPLTLMSANIERIFLGLQYFHEAVISVPVLALALWLLEKEIGLGAIAPVAIVGVLALIIGVCVPGIAKSQKQWLNAIQSRTKRAAQLLLNFRSAKMTGLMKHLAQQLQDARLSELDTSLAARRYQVMTNSLGLGAPNLIPVLALGVYAGSLSAVGQTLNLYQAFTALAFVVLITFPIGVLLQTAPLLVMALASLNQIDTYVRQEGRQAPNLGYTVRASDNASEKDPSRPLDSPYVFTAHGCSIKRPSSKKEVLRELDFSISRNAFTFILGPSASGKSTLLETLLDEIQPCAGSLVRAAKAQDIAYVAQTPWIRNASVDANIVQGLPFNEQWYREVIHAVALEKDLQQISRGTIGIGGTGLSGGQKQKLSLARALYSRRPIIIIDEPFSGIDAISAMEISDRVFGAAGMLRKHKITLILSSHSAKNARFADHVLILNADGRIAQQGPPASLDLSSYTASDNRASESQHNHHKIDESANPVAYQEVTSHARNKDRRTGDAMAYYYYFRSLGWLLVPTCFLVASLVFFEVFPQYWVTWWTDSNARQPNNRMGYWIGLYALWGVLAVLSLFVACCLMLLNMVQSSGGSLHAMLVETVEHATMSTFTTMSPGLTVNRFNQDMSLVDMELPIQFANTGILFVTCIAQFIVVVTSSKYLAIAVPFALAVVVTIQQLYIRTSRQLRFLDIESKSPLYSHFIETLNGLSTIRAFGLQESLSLDMNSIIDDSQKPFYLLYCAQRYLGLTLNFVVAGLSVILVGVAIATHRQAGTLYYGVSLVNIMTFGFNLAEFIDQWTRFEVGLAAVERTREFHATTARETTAQVDHGASEPFDEGHVEVIDLSVGYKPDNMTLRGISITIAAGEKVAVCGRSGSGKSTLCFALLRMLECEQGTITIDGRDISRIQHGDLRHALGSVPQDPLILEGSLRYNLDPLAESSENDLLDVLRRVGLTPRFSGALDDDMSAETLSFAEKQMICLARALLKARKVMILDEATSSVDLATEKTMQEIVCQELPGVTVIAVMHRFNHIHMYDKILVMSQGLIVEEGAPSALLARSDSHFAQLYATERHA